MTLVLGQGIAVAQQPAADPPAQPPAGQPVDAGLHRQVNLSPQEQLATADADMARMEQSRSVVRRALMEARDKRDVVKTLCLNDKLTQMNVAISSAQERRDALAGAVKRGDADLATHEFTILSVLRQRSDQLSAEASQCIGEEAGFVGQSSVTVDIDPIPDDVDDFPKFSIMSEPPMCASCYN